jgi:hypothetical protein
LAKKSSKLVCPHFAKTLSIQNTTSKKILKLAREINSVHTIMGIQSFIEIILDKVLAKHRQSEWAVFWTFDIGSNIIVK